jgi:hypothetical protein
MKVKSEPDLHYCSRHQLGRKNRVTIFLNGQFIIVYTCKPHVNQKYSLVRITSWIFSSKMLYSADEKDRDSIFTTIMTIWKPGLINKTCPKHARYTNCPLITQIFLQSNVVILLASISSARTYIEREVSWRRFLQTSHQKTVWKRRYASGLLLDYQWSGRRKFNQNVSLTHCWGSLKSPNGEWAE